MPTYRILRGFFNLEKEDGEREIKKRGDTIRLSEKRAVKYGASLEIVTEPIVDSASVEVETLPRREEGKIKTKLRESPR